MSITKAAPKGWEFQYAATCLIGLRHLSETEAVLVVEPKKGEDAELVLKGSISSLKFEIQSKSSQADLGLEDLAELLAHFPEYESSNPLLQRLLENPKSIALVVSGGRCTDATRSFLTQPGIVDAHKQTPLNRGNQRLFLKVFEGVYVNETSKLGVSRTASCKSLRDLFRRESEKLDNVLSRVLVWEQQTIGFFEQTLSDELTRKWMIPRSVSERVIFELIKAVHTGRDMGCDVMPLLKKTVNRHAGSRILHESHFPRDIDEELFAALKSRRVLLLSGLPKCGKTHTAKFLSDRMARESATYENFNDVSDADRFLTAIGDDERVCILEDPFGPIELSANAAEVLDRLRKLISTLPCHRFLIVTSRSDILQLLVGAETICGNAWRDVTVEDPQFLLRYWTETCEDRGLAKEAFKTVSANLANSQGTILLQLGQLTHLSMYSGPVSPTDFQALCRIARYNSSDFANAWKRRSSAALRLQLALALSASTVVRVSLESLNYILSSLSTRPGISHKTDIGFSIGGEDTPLPDFPSYGALSTIHPDYLVELGYLEQRLYIDYEGGQIAFTHPDYQEASNILMLTRPSMLFEDLVDIASRALSCLNPATGRHCLRMLCRMHSVYTKTTQRVRLTELAFDGLKSIFPSVRDLAMTVLISWIADLEANSQRRTLEEISRMDSTSYNLVLWNGDTPWIDTRQRLSFEQYWSHGELEEGLTEGYREALLNSVSFARVTVKEAWGLLEHLKTSVVHDREVRALKALIRFDEVFIRADAAFLLMANLKSGDTDAVALAFGDDHPTVVFRAVLGSFSGWHRTQEVRLTLRSAIIAAFSKISVVARGNRFLIDFGDAEKHREANWNALSDETKREFWQLWADIFCVFLPTIANASIRIDQANLWNTAIESKEYLSSDQIVKVCEAWFGWIEAQIQSQAMPNDYGMAVSAFLIEGVASSPDKRENLSLRLLNHPDTAFVVTNLRECIRHWEMLTPIEKQAVSSLCSSNRSDIRWIKAVALSSANPPPSIVNAILGMEAAFELPPANLIKIIPEDLMADCLNVYCSDHPVFHYLGLANENSELWHGLLQIFGERPESAQFQLATDEMLTDTFNGQQIWPRPLHVWKTLCQEADFILRQRLFNTLLRATVRVVSSRSRAFWRIFFHEVKDQTEYADYLSVIAEYIEAIEWAADDLLEIFGRKRFLEDILPLLTNDELACYVLIEWNKSGSALDDQFLGLIESVYARATPRSKFVHERIIRKLDKISGEKVPAVRETVETERIENINRGSSQKMSFEKVVASDPPSWIRWQGGK